MTSNFEVVISGISGRFPGCDDVRTFQEKLYNSESFISENNRKWPHDYKYNGKYTKNKIFIFIKYKLTNPTPYSSVQARLYFHVFPHIFIKNSTQCSARKLIYQFSVIKNKLENYSTTY